MLFKVQFQTTHKRELGEQESIFLRFMYTEMLNSMFFVNTLDWCCPLRVMLHSFQTQQLVQVSALLLL